MQGLEFLDICPNHGWFEHVRHSMLTRLTTFGLAAVLLTACSEEPPPRSVEEFIANPVVLEAVMVRCSRNRAETRYEAECLNAREAVDRILAREKALRRAELEAESERKREALRRTQRAAAEARRRAAEAARLREEAEYLAQFGEVPAELPPAEDPGPAGNAPVAVIPAPAGAGGVVAGEGRAAEIPVVQEPMVELTVELTVEPMVESMVEPTAEEPPGLPETPGERGDASNAETESQAPASLDAIRDELRRRSLEVGNEDGNEPGDTAGQ